MRPAADDDTPVFVISVAAALSGMHAQTLRQYDRLGLVSPTHRGGGRRYSARDVARPARFSGSPSREGVSLAGIQRILELENQVDATPGAPDRGDPAARRGGDRAGTWRRVFAAGPAGDIVSVRPGAPRRTSLGGSSPRRMAPQR